MQRLVSTLLKREGYRVDAFLTGRDALRAMEKTDYHVLLLDLMMPHEGGIRDPPIAGEPAGPSATRPRPYRFAPVRDGQSEERGGGRGAKAVRGAGLD